MNCDNYLHVRGHHAHQDRANVDAASSSAANELSGGNLWDQVISSLSASP